MKYTDKKAEVREESMKTTDDYCRQITRALRDAGKYSKSLDIQVLSLASALRALAIPNKDIDSLESTTVTVISRYGNEAPAPHPVFKILKDTLDSVTRQMKALGLTAEELEGGDDNDPLIDLTKKVKAAGRKKPVVVRRTAAPEEGAAG